MNAIVYERSIPRWMLSNIAAKLGKTIHGARPISLKEIAPPKLPNNNWVPVKPILSGICGSDLATVAGKSSGYFEQVSSFPFTLGHEIVGTTEDGTRVVVEPALGCAVRDIKVHCKSCGSGYHGTCENITAGSISPGLQTGYCKSTGGGWSDSFVAHVSQLHTVPDDMTDEAAVMVEPTACAVHGVQRVDTSGADIAVIGAGTVGLLTIAALKQLCQPASLTVAAKHPHQQRLASELGASVLSSVTSPTSVTSPKELLRNIRLSTQSTLLPKTLLSPPRLTSGVDVVFDCVGNAASITQALAIVRPRGRIVLVGMPGRVSIDMAPLWQREIELIGAYAYAHSHDTSDFTTAMELVQSANLGRLVSARYPLTSYADAIDHATHAGQRAAVKITFDIRRTTHA